MPPYLLKGACRQVLYVFERQEAHPRAEGSFADATDATTAAATSPRKETISSSSTALVDTLVKSVYTVKS